MTKDTIWNGDPCPNKGCPYPGPILSWWFYRRKPWVCPICCYGWVRQDRPDDSDTYRMIRTRAPVPYYRPGKRRAQSFKPSI